MYYKVHDVANKVHSKTSASVSTSSATCHKYEGTNYISTNFAIKTNQSSEVLDRAIQRYSSIITEHDVNQKFASACDNAMISISINLLTSSSY